MEGQGAASVAYEDDVVLVFMDTSPVNTGHLLVIPKANTARLADLDEETGAQLFRVAMRMAAALRSSDVRCEGVNFFLADGEVAFQEVFHVHLHVLPRFHGTAFGSQLDWPAKPSREELDEVAKAIRQAYEELYRS